MTADFLRRLELPDAFTEADLENAFRQKSLLLHPDRGGSKHEFQQLHADYEAAKAFLTQRQKWSGARGYDPTVEWLQSKARLESYRKKVYFLRTLWVVPILFTMVLLALAKPAMAVGFSLLVLPFGLIGTSFAVANAKPGLATIATASVAAAALLVGLASGPENLIHLELGTYAEMQVVSVMMRVLALACAIFAITVWLASLSDL